MTLWAFDTETYLITKTDKAPKPVVCSWYNGVNNFLTLPSDEMTLQILSDPNAHFVGHNMAYDLGVMMRWHPVTIPLIVRALDEGRVWDTQIREQLQHLHNVGEREFPKFISLSKLEEKYLGLDRSAQKKGEDVWRLKYGTLDGIPLANWPAEAVQYALDDTKGTYDVFTMQGGPQGFYNTEQLQNQASLALHLTSVWGMGTNQENVAKVKKRIEEKMAGLKAQLDAFTMEATVRRTVTRNKQKQVIEEVKTMGIVGKGTNAALHQLVLQGWQQKHMKALSDLAAKEKVYIVWENIMPHLNENVDLGLFLLQSNVQWCYDSHIWNPPGFIKKAQYAVKPVPRTSRGPKAGADDIQDILEFVPILKVRSDYKHEEKMLATYVTPYENTPSIHASFNVMMGTGRTSCSSPNLQNIIRGEGFRHNLRARAGYLLGTVDYSALEMVTFAATTVARRGTSPMADAINQGKDLHCLTASGLFGHSYEKMLEEVAKEKKQKRAGHTGPFEFSDMRQGSKALNFGGLGGLGAKAFQPYAKFTYGVDWTEKECGKRIRQWKSTWPEVSLYLRLNSEACENTDGNRATATNNMGREKANCSYTQLCNYPFQSLAADGVKASMWELLKHQLLGWFWTYASDLWTTAQQLMGEQWGVQHLLYHASPLRESHMVNMVHDELVMEHPEHLAQEAFALQQKIMVDTMRRYTTGVEPSVEGELGVEWEH